MLTASDDDQSYQCRWYKNSTADSVYWGSQTDTESKCVKPLHSSWMQIDREEAYENLLINLSFAKIGAVKFIY